MKATKSKIKKVEYPGWDLWRDGVTSSMLAKFLACREQFRLCYVEGWSSRQPRSYLEFGNVVHYVLEHVYRNNEDPSDKKILKLIEDFEKTWKVYKPGDREREEILGMAEVVCLEYFAYYGREDAALDWLGTEDQFKFPFAYHDGRQTWLCGKQDGKFKRKKDVWLFDTKTKGEINEDDIADALLVDLQMFLYLYVLDAKGEKPRGCRYNIIRRPSHRRMDKTLKDFLQHIRADIQKRPDHFFKRLDMEITKGDIDTFKPTLVGILDDVRAYFEGRIPHYLNSQALKWGNAKSEYFDAITKGDYSGLVKRSKIFPELD